MVQSLEVRTTQQRVRTIAVVEAFGPTIQGEGALIGKPTVFVRTGGCEFRCSWCDTLYAVLPEYKAEWTPMTAEAIMDEVRRLSSNQPILVTLSGGNPAIQPLGGLIDLGHEAGYTFALETQGSVAQPWFERLDYLTLSPKPPSSKQVTRWDRLDRCVAYADNDRGDKGVQVCLKVVVFDEEDYAYARYVAARYPAIPFYLQPGNETVGNFDLTKVLQKLEWLINKVTADRWNSVAVLPQLHTLIWQNQRGK